MKMNLPVMLLRESIFLPYSELKLEFNSESSKNIVDEAEFFHDNKLLVAFQNNPLEENPTLDEISKIGIMAHIDKKIELPDGTTRIVLKGLERATIYEFLNANEPDETLESIIICDKLPEIETTKEKALLAKLGKEIETYISTIPYVSNSFIEKMHAIEHLNELTDMIVTSLSFSSSKIKKYIIEFDPIKRMEMLLTDIYKEKESYQIESEIDDKVQEGMNQNQKEYLIKEKIKVLKQEIGETDFKEEDVKHLRKKLTTTNFPELILARLEKELNRYESLPIISPELNLVRNYIDALIDIPFGVYTQDVENLVEVQKKLNISHYDLEKVKARIIEFLAAKQMSPNLKSPILCLVGPPGTGKTSLASAVACALGRKFVKMSVGGMSDEGEIIGHRRTYLGASAGKIVSLLTRSRSMNPVFLIDEIDKIVKTEKGDPYGTLLEILDPVQNKYFTDNYIEEEIDLSKVFFITTANDITSIPEELLDRLEIIHLEGYTEYEKLEIASQHLIPSICENYGLSIKKLAIDEKALTKIIREYTKESGVRELERKLSDIVRKIITGIVINKRTEDKYYVMQNDVSLYLGPSIYPVIKRFKGRQKGIVNALAYSTHGGDVLRIEVNYFKGTGKLILTGTLGDIIKESAMIAHSYIKANAAYFGLDCEKLLENDVHIHIPDGSIPKDGPSAGIALTTALISSLGDLQVSGGLAMTGEITLTGHILPVGKIKEKIMGAYTTHIEKVIVPFQNKEEVALLPSFILEKMKIYYVKNYRECYRILKGYMYGRKNKKTQL